MQKSKSEPQIIDATIGFEENADGLLIHQQQEIPEEYLSQLRLERANSLSLPSGEFHRVCSIPILLANKWKAEGFDVWREPVREIIKRLHKHQLDVFITSNKRV